MSLGGQTTEGGEHLAGGAQGVLEGMGATDDSRGSGRQTLSLEEQNTKGEPRSCLVPFGPAPLHKWFPQA